jgi:hypothetical protein
VSAFALEDGVVYHTYSAYERGLDVLWGMYQWLDRAPSGRNETGFWRRRHDEYDSLWRVRKAAVGCPRRRPSGSPQDRGRLKKRKFMYAKAAPRAGVD